MPIPPSTNISATRHAAKRRGACAVGAGALAALLACSVALAAPPVTVTNARIRLLPGDLPLAGYFDLVNRGRRPVALTAASSPAFEMVHLHRSIERDGTATMVTADDIKVKPGATLHFAPGGYHLMLMQRVKPLQVGDKVPMTLQFADRQTLRVIFEVKSAETQ
ncbi:MAG: copper chaperone PCu(A)C [Sulfuricaulis sp.]